MMIRSAFSAAALAALLAVAQVQTVPKVDLDRYLGEWHEVARYPNRFQKSCVSDVVATYSKRDDGRINVLNRCKTADGGVKDAEGVARIVDEATNAQLKVRFAPAALSFLPFVWGDYWIIGLADDYSWAVVGSPDREYLWILARRPQLEAGTYDIALAAARAQGFDVSKLVRTQASAESGVEGAGSATGAVASADRAGVRNVRRM